MGGTGDTELTLTREGDFVGSTEDIVEEINIFEGAFNRITFEQVYTKTFKCTYQLQLYPFDTQVCTVNLIVRNLETSVMEIRPHKIRMESETVLTQYLITNWTLAYNNATNVDSGIQMTIVLKRRILNSILTVYLPTVLVLIIVYATNFFKDFFFEAIVTVNLTSLLVLTTLFISVSSSLPQTAYVKMVDVWLIFAQVVPWIYVLLHTLTDWMRPEEGREVNHHGKSITVGQKQDTDSVLLVEGQSSVNHDMGRPFTGRSSRHAYADMTQADEKKKVDAVRDFYKNLSGNFTAVERLQLLTRAGVPVFILAFSALYWGYGLTMYMN